MEDPFFDLGGVVLREIISNNVSDAKAAADLKINVFNILVPWQDHASIARLQEIDA